MKKTLISFVILLVVGLMAAGTSFAGEVMTINDAFANGKTSGTIGTYMEYKDRDAADLDTSWGTAYLNLKYETATWKNIKAGAAFMAHGDFFNEADLDGIDPFSTDIESEYTLPELYVDISLFNNSNLVAGRFNHKKVTHIDDAQSEGAYLSLKEIENVDIVGGFMTRFAEIDYDDGEDFGRTNKAQDLSSDTYGADSEDYMLFLEVKTELADMLKLNPYVMYQDDYATVAGIDTVLYGKLNEMTIGAKVNYYNVSTDLTGIDDATVYGIYPFVKEGAWKVKLGYVKFDDGTALNKPAWLTENHMDFSDQQMPYGLSGSELYLGKVKYSAEKWWAHLLYSVNKYDMSTTYGDKAKTYEIQVGADIYETVDAVIRLFDVSFDNVENMDYKKVEARIRKKF